MSKTTKTSTTTTTPSTTNKIDQIDLTNYSTTSSKIRYLHSLNFTRGQISKHLNIRYQHVRNVLITPVKNPK